MFYKWSLVRWTLLPRSLGNRGTDRRFEFLQGGFDVGRVPQDVKIVVRVKVARYLELRFLTRVDNRLTKSLSVPGLPVGSEITMREVHEEEARGLNLHPRRSSMSPAG